MVSVDRCPRQMRGPSLIPGQSEVHVTTLHGPVPEIGVDRCDRPLRCARAIPPKSPARLLRPARAARRMVVPEGFHVEVFVAEPMVRQPLSASFDDRRGRLWVVEYLRYPNPAGLKPVTVDQRYLRARTTTGCPDPPPRGPSRCPTGSRFWRIPTATDARRQGDGFRRQLEPGLGARRRPRRACSSDRRLSSCSIPTRTTTTGPMATRGAVDRLPGSRDAHATANSLTWDRRNSWLYGAQGSTVTAPADRGYESSRGSGGFASRHPPVRGLRRGGGSSRGARLRLDPATHSAAVTAPTSPSMVGAVTTSRGSPSTGRFSSNPHPHTSPTSAPFPTRGSKQGGHVTPGGIIYSGDALPAPIPRARSVGGNLLSNAVCWHSASRRQGSTFSGRHGGTLIDARDRWFRPDRPPGRTRCREVYVRRLVRQALPTSIPATPGIV